MSANIRFISAGAGSGKTYRITEELQAMLGDGSVTPAGVMATTFTRRAATELSERVRQKLLASGKTQLAAQMGQALIGTVNSVCGKLVERFAFEAGLSPEQSVIEEEQARRMFAAALEEVLGDQQERMTQLNALSSCLGITDGRSDKDWRDTVMDIARAARANNMGPDQVRECGRSSAQELLGMFAQPYTGDFDMNEELLGVMTAAIDAFDAQADATKTSAKYFDRLRSARSWLRQGRMPWSEWVALSKAAPAKKSVALSEPVQTVAGDYERHPDLHRNICDFINDVFALAAQSIEAYQVLKARHGVLDFVDQEQRLFELLDHAEVKAALADELQVLLVDEFQDTSPIQLALFVKLAALADQVVWVGDVKQAIYDFRGSDPQLMQAVLRGVEAGGGTTEVLQNSWRSRPALVDYVNQVFVPTFADSLPPEQVKLEARRDEAGDQAAVACWRLDGSNAAIRAAQLAYALRSLLDQKYRVIDKTLGTGRAVGYGDIAVLCRSNSRLLQVAEACAKAGVPVAFKRRGLLATPEAVLALACLRRLADAGDSLASAEIRSLSHSETAESWLPERLAYVESEQDARGWGETGTEVIPVLRDLAIAREQMADLSPREALELALTTGRVRETAIAWGPNANRTRHRLRNLDLMLDYAELYQDQCQQQNVAATAPGLILWFDELARREEDLQAEASDGRAVTLVTHHGAKGLEWPVVIAVDLEANVRSRLWGLSVRQREDGFDMYQPLLGRRLRYWPWPFGRQSAGIDVAERIEQSDAGAAARAAAMDEERRLLYVSFTRPRDLLVMPLPAKKSTGPSLETLAADWLVPRGDSLTLPDGTSIPTSSQLIEVPEGWTPQLEVYAPRWVAQREQTTGLVPRNLTPSAAEPSAACVVGDVEQIGERIPLDGVKDVAALGSALHSIIAAQVKRPDTDDAARSAAVLERWDMAAVVTPALALRAAQEFIEWMRVKHAPVAWHVEYPVTHVLETGQVMQGFIDLLMETGDGFVIVDYKASPRPRNEWRDIAAGYSGQIHAYKAAVEASGRQVIGCYIYFAVGGGLIPLAF